MAAGTQQVASLTWHAEDEGTVEAEICGRSYWCYLQRARAIDSKQLGNVSAFRVDAGSEEEVMQISDDLSICGQTLNCATYSPMVWLVIVCIFFRPCS